MKIPLYNFAFLPIHPTFQYTPIQESSLNTCHIIRTNHLHAVNPNMSFPCRSVLIFSLFSNAFLSCIYLLLHADAFKRSILPNCLCLSYTHRAILTITKCIDIYIKYNFISVPVLFKEIYIYSIYILSFSPSFLQQSENYELIMTAT